MINSGNRTEHFLYFATNRPDGLSKMKEAMWKADPMTGEAFSDLTDTKQMLLDQAADLLPLRRLLGQAVEVISRGIGTEPLEDGEMSVARGLFDRREADEALFVILRRHSRSAEGQ